MRMISGRAITLTVLLVATGALALPAPTVVFTRNANNFYQGCVATCPVTVVSNTSAFVCYTDGISGNQTVQYVNPQVAGANGVQAGFAGKNTFIYPPIAVSPTSAVAFASGVNDSFYVLFNSTNPQVQYVNRRGSVADVVYAPDLGMSFVPIGVMPPKVGWYDSIEAFDITTSNNESLKWSRSFNVPVNYPYTTRMSTPVYYKGFLYVATRDRVYELNALTGAITKNVSDPCNFGLQEDQWIMLQVVSVGSDENGSLDAFILTANTSTAQMPQISVCRFSHNTFNYEWRTDYDDNVRIDDVIGAMGTLVITGLLTDITAGYITWTIDVTSGVHGGTITRFEQDKMSFPAILAQPVGGCQSTVVLQVQGNLTAYCQTDVTTAIWTSPYGCTFRPTIVNQTNSILCTSWGTSVQHLDSYGLLIWQNSAIKAYFTASVVNNLAWVVDQHATVYALTLDAFVPPPPPQPTVIYRNQVSQSVASITSICPPTIQSSSSAFVCYKNNGTDTLQFVNPLDSTRNGNPIPIPGSTDFFVFPPIAVGLSTAVAFTADPRSSSYVVFNNNNLVTLKDRAGSTAQVTYAPAINTSFVPFGVSPRVGWYDSLEALDNNATTEQSSIRYSLTFPVPSGYNYTNSISTPVYYGGFLFVATRTKFIKYNATTGSLMASITNPCNLTAAAGPLTMTVVTFGHDANGPLDAFVMYANTSTATGVSFSVCRVSHSSGSLEWQVTLNDDFFVMDVTGANGVVLVSGQVRSIANTPYSFAVMSLDVTNGGRQGTLFRTQKDASSFPVVLARPINACAETIILQVDGKLSAYCTETIAFAPEWTSDFTCTHRPLIDATSNSIFCTTWGTSVQRLSSADGSAIWQTQSVTGVFTPFIVDGIVWAVDLHATLYAFSFEPAGVTTTTTTTTAAPATTTTTAAPGATTTTPAPGGTHAPNVPPTTTTAAPGTPPPQGEAPSGLGAGGSAGVAIAVIIVIGAAAGGAFVYHRRNVRRKAFRDTRVNDAINEGGYGGLE
ncbi:membrane-associated protein, putative [Bodo saltans]|uniref:Membrane-associated protein, putative n=1 Tax=Bodo saltans TaxID=75058 RepID=A0A0S4JHY4_BODSA|nr:membrane-associated protein, putative [Bodo saltans]|eukprot:CUG89632.1 membrane-associated protein, putative [Bodo saltans]